MIPIKVDDREPSRALNLTLLDLGIGLGICRSLCIEFSVCVLIQINLGGIIRHRNRLGNIATESDDAPGVTVIIAFRDTLTIVFFVRRLEEDFSTRVVWSCLDL